MIRNIVVPILLFAILQLCGDLGKLAKLLGGDSDIQYLAKYFGLISHQFICLSIIFYLVKKRFVFIGFLILLSIIISGSDYFRLFYYGNLKMSHSAFGYYCATISLFAIYGLLKFRSWSIDKLKSDTPYAVGLYLICTPPNTIITFIQSLFGYGIGGVKWVVRTKDGYFTYKMPKGENVFARIAANDFKVPDGCLCIKVKGINENNIAFLIQKIDTFVGSKYALTKNNCVTVMREPLRSLGINANTIFPSRILYHINS